MAILDYLVSQHIADHPSNRTTATARQLSSHWWGYNLVLVHYQSKMFCRGNNAAMHWPLIYSNFFAFFNKVWPLSGWGVWLCCFLEPPASIVIYTEKYADCYLILYIPVQIRAVSVQDYPSNSCNAASPQLISLWMSAERAEIYTSVISPNYIFPSELSISSTRLLFKRHNSGFLS